MKKVHLVLIVVLLLGLNPLFGQHRKAENTPLPTGPQRATVSVDDMTDGVTKEDLVDKLVGGGITVSNITYTGADVASGIFEGGMQSGIGIEEGIILSSGSAKLAIGPNQADNASQNNNRAGDPDLDALVTGDVTLDACILEFDFVPQTENLQFTFVMGSDEYEEYIDYHDVFAFFLNGVNIALIPGTNTPISIGTINPNVNPSYYVSNYPFPGTHDIECDGFTIPISVNATVIPGETNHIKLAVADYMDYVWDTWIFMKAETFISGVNVFVDSAPQGAHIFKDGVDTGLTTPDTISQVIGTTSVYHLEMDGCTWIPPSITVENIQSDQSIFFDGVCIPDETTPVELSSFTATISAQGFVALRWVSESETDMLGYKVLRSDNDQLSDAEIITPFLIGATNTSSQMVYGYEDHDVLSNHSYYYWLEVVNMNSSQFFGPVMATTSGHDTPTPDVPLINKLHNAYPNPFNPSTTISYSLQHPSHVELDIFNIQGQKIRTLTANHSQAGFYNIIWDGKDYNGLTVPSGVYYYRIQAGSFSETKKMVMSK